MSLVILLLFVILFWSCYSVTRVNIYPIPEETIIHLENLPGAEIIKIEDKIREINGVFLKGNEKLVIIFHGNGGTVNSEFATAKFFMEKECSILIPEYPGYGVVKKYEANEKNIYQDADTLIRYVQDKYGFSPVDTTVYGRSLGAAVAIEMVTRSLGQKLICVTPFSSMSDLCMAYGAPFFVLPIINDQNFDNVKKAKSIQYPTLIISGNEDNKIPHWMSVKLSKNFVNNEFIILETEKHANIYEDFNDEIWQKIINF